MKVDIVTAVDTLASFGLLRSNKIINNYYSIYCPFHNDGNERKASFGISIHEEVRAGQVYPEGFCHCFTCGYADTLPNMLRKILSTKSVASSILEWIQTNIFDVADYEYEKLIPDSLSSSVISKFAVSQIQQLQQPEPTFVTEEELSKYRYTVPYMYERKLTDEIIEKFDVGVDLNWIPEGRVKPVPCITFPVNNAEGKTLFICRRSIKGKLYNYPQGSVKPVYGIDKLPASCTSICVCESIINALTLWSWGYYAVALLGTGNSVQCNQIKRLGLREVTLCLDGDDAGHKGTARLKRQLSSQCVVWIVDIPHGKDVNDLEKDEFDKLYKARR